MSSLKDSDASKLDLVPKNEMNGKRPHSETLTDGDTAEPLQKKKKISESDDIIEQAEDDNPGTYRLRQEMINLLNNLIRRRHAVLEFSYSDCADICNTWLCDSKNHATLVDMNSLLNDFPTKLESLQKKRNHRPNDCVA